MSGENSSVDALHVALDRVSSTIPFLCSASVDLLQQEPEGVDMTPSLVAELRSALGREAAWVLGRIDDRLSDDSVNDYLRGGLVGRRIVADAGVRLYKDTFSRLWNAILCEIDELAMPLLLERAGAFFSAATEIVETILRSSLNGGTDSPCGRRVLSLERRRHLITSALLRGEQPEAELVGDDIVVANRYCVLAMPKGALSSQGQAADEKGWLVAVARKQATAVVLVPLRKSQQETPDAVAQHAFDALSSPGPVGLALAGSIRDVPAAVDDAQEAYMILGRLDHAKPRLYRLDDLLLEAMLCRSRELAARLAGRLAPVAVQTPHLLDTLEAFLDSDCERRELARQLYIHPNTLSYRLKRIWELTGLSLTNVRDLTLLKASLVALRIVRSDDVPHLAAQAAGDKPDGRRIPQPVPAT